MPPPPTDPELVLARDDRLRQLARALVRDPARADDLVQDTWLAWLEHGAGVRSLSAWLATLVRRGAVREHRSESRRARREQAAAQAEAGASTAEILEREEARARVVAALTGLDEPLRTTLVLRFLEDQPPRKVAARMRVSVETVRTRTRRGLELLRAELDRSFEARERWLSVLLPPVGLPRPSLRLPLAAMPLSTQLAVSGVALALLAWLLWPREPARAVTALSLATTTPASLTAEIEATRPAPELARAASADTRESHAAPSAPAPVVASETTGSLRVLVRWPDGAHASGPGAAGRIVRVIPGTDENPDLHRVEAVTDATGRALFASLPPGEARVAVDRYFAPPSRVTIVAGAEAELEIRTGHGFDILGLVTDEAEHPVADAEIWLGQYPNLAHGNRVARSAADGTFRLDGLSHAHLGARAPGYRPSKIAYFYGREGEVRARLVLGPDGGELEGRVTDLTGRPLSGATVCVGPPGPLEWNTIEDLDGPWGTLARSDEEGRFHVAGLHPGACPLVVRRPGFALFRGEVEIPVGASASFVAALAPEAALAGRVRDSRGAPVSGALVRVGREEGPFRASARTQADGSFHVGALEPGVTLEAWIEDAPGTAQTEFRSEVGVTAQWEPTLAELGEIRGRALDERGEPLLYWTVHLVDQEPGLLESDQASLPTQPDGSFAFTHVHHRPHTLSLTAAGAGFSQSLARANVFPGADELVLTVPDASIPSTRIAGTFLDEEGRPLPNAHVLPWAMSSTGASFETCDPRTGRFDIGPYPPGPTKLVLRAAGRAVLVRGPRTLAAGETWDVGEVRLEPEGRLRVRLVPAGCEASEAVRITLDAFLGDFEGSGSERLSPPLAPGAYEMRLSGGGVEELALPFVIEGGVETVLEVPLRRGWRAPVAVRAPDSVLLGKLRVELASGPLEAFLWQREGDRFVEALWLAPGSYLVEATAGELAATGTLVVEPVDREQPALVLELH